MKQMTGETRCEKCSEILLTDYEENGVSYSIFHERLKITTLDKSQSRFGLCCPTCDHTTVHNDVRTISTGSAAGKENPHVPIGHSSETSSIKESLSC
jgi:hypothetical protein